jgi:hypothetical protein
MYTTTLDGVNFAKTIKKTPIIIIKFIKKHIDDKNILATFKKHSYFYKCGIIKILKIQKSFKIASKFQNFKIPLPHINGL